MWSSQEVIRSDRRSSICGTTVGPRKIVGDLKERIAWLLSRLMWEPSSQTSIVLTSDCKLFPQVPKFFQFFLECIDYCDTKSPLNRPAPALRSSGILQHSPVDLLSSPSPAMSPEDRKETIRD